MIMRKITSEECKDDVMGNVGIQLGSSATSKESRKIDASVKDASLLLYNRYKEKYDLKWIPKLKQSQIPFGIGACTPDGGIFIRQGRFVLAPEAKYQKADANAIERWHKNHNILRMLNPYFTYITFAAGEAITKAIPKALNVLHLGEPNVYHPFYNTIIYSKEFTFDMIYHHLESLFLLTMEGIDNNETSIYVGRWQDKINQALSSIYA